MPLAETALAAEDLVLGYRVDIRREDNPWRSTCERNAEYTINDVVMGPADALDSHLPEEGHVKPFTAVKDADGGLQADETVLRWDGWSFALPTLESACRHHRTRPRSQSTSCRTGSSGTSRSRPAGCPRCASPTATRCVSASPTSPAAGWGSTRSTTTKTASDSITYRRHDPIQPPTLRAAGGFTPGAAIDVLVIRSDNGQPDPDYPLTETRAVDPPTAPLQLIEQHRMLDGLTDEQSFELAQRAMRADAAGSGLPDPAAEGINAFVPAEPGGLEESRSRRIKWVPVLAQPEAQVD